MGVIKNEFSFTQLASVIEKEYSLWMNGQLMDYNSEAVPMMQKYWGAAGKSYTQENFTSEQWQNTHPWSAAYIIWVMNQVDPSFPGSEKISEFTKAALNNRNQSLPGWKLYSLSREKNPILAQPGDILVMPRAESEKGNDKYYFSRADIVWKVDSGKAYLSGGNLQGSVKSQMIINLTGEGAYPENPTSSYFTQSKYITLLKKM